MVRRLRLETLAFDNEDSEMPTMRVAMAALALGACSLITISDPYGNRYGGWYEHGEQYRWQLDLCEQQMAALAIPSAEREFAMRCCMADHGVPIDDPDQCRQSSKR